MQIKIHGKIAEENRQKLKRSISEIQQDLITPNDVKTENSLKRDDIIMNMNVYVPSLDMEASICKMPDKNGNVQIQSGIVKLNINVAKLERPKKEAKKEKVTYTSTSVNKSKNISSEVMLIGMTVDEAIPVLEKYIDDAYLASIGSIRIVHGKGTGTLKKAVHSLLSKHPHIKSYRLGMYGEGDSGVTIAEIE